MELSEVIHFLSTRDKRYSIIWCDHLVDLLARENICALLETTTQVDNQDFRSDYSPIKGFLVE